MLTTCSAAMMTTSKAAGAKLRVAPPSCWGGRIASARGGGHERRGREVGGRIAGARGGVAKAKDKLWLAVPRAVAVDYPPSSFRGKATTQWHTRGSVQGTGSYVHWL